MTVLSKLTYLASSAISVLISIPSIATAQGMYEIEIGGEKVPFPFRVEAPQKSGNNSSQSYAYRPEDRNGPCEYGSEYGCLLKNGGTNGVVEKEIARYQGEVETRRQRYDKELKALDLDTNGPVYAEAVAEVKKTIELRDQAKQATEAAWLVTSQSLNRTISDIDARQSSSGGLEHEPDVISEATLPTVAELSSLVREGIKGLAEISSSLSELEIPPIEEVARVAVSVTPGLNDVADFTEFVTGRSAIPPHPEISLESQVYAGIGLMFGSRMFWEATAASAGNIARVCSEKFGIEANPAAAERVGALWKEISKSRDLKYFDPFTKGPLTDIPASEKMMVADTFRTNSYIQHTLQEEVRLYRVWSGGDPNRALGRYWTRVKPTGPHQAMYDSAIDPRWGNPGTHWIEIEVPRGTTLFEGIAGPINTKDGGQLVGGGHQVWVQKVDRNWKVDEGSFE